MPDDFPASTGSGARVAANSFATGIVEEAGDQDWFGATLQAGREYVIDLLGTTGGFGSLSDPYIRGIYTDGGAFLAGTYDDDSGDGLNSRLRFTPSATGLYFIAAGAYSSYTGSYRLTLTTTGNADDFASDTSTTGATAVGGSATGIVEVAGDQDWFAVTLVSGHGYRIDLAGAPTGAGTLSDPYLRGVYTAGGILLSGTSDDDSGDGLNSQVSFTPAATGTYYVAAGAYGSNTGSYRVSVTDTGAVDDFAENVGTTGAVAVGGSASGQIDQSGDVDWFAVALQAGHSYRIDLQGVATGAGSLSDPYLRGMFDAGGAPVNGTTDDDGGEGLDSQLLFTPSASGTYFVAAGAYSSYTGTYRVAVADLGALDDFAASTATTGTVAVGGSAAGDIETAYDEDWFAVSLAAGQAYRIDLVGAGLADTYLRGIHSADGTLLPGTTDDDSGGALNSRVLFTAPSSGTYYVAAGAYSAGTGDYLLSVTGLGSADDYGADVATTGQVAPASPAHGTIEIAGDQDWFAATLQGGLTYRISLRGSPTGGGTLSDPYLRGIHAADGTLLSGTEDDDSGDGTDSRLEFTPSATGTYFIAAGAYSSGTGSYTLTVEPLTRSDDYAASSATAGAVAEGGQLVASIDFAGDRDWFAVSLQAGMRYRVDLLGQDGAGGSLGDPFLYGVRLADGTPLAGSSDDDGGVGLSSLAEFSAPATGTFYVDAGAYAQGLGTYTVALTRIGGGGDDFADDATTTGVAALGGTSTGTIEVAGDRDWFAVQLLAGHVYQVDLESATDAAGPLSDTYLHGVYSAAGTLLPGTTDDDSGPGLNSRTVFTAATTGTHYVGAGAFGSNTGAYKVHVIDLGGSDDFAATAATTGSLAVGGTATGNIETAGDEDWFAVTLAAGIAYRIDLEGTATGNGTLSDPYLRGIHDGVGTLLAASGDDDGGVGLNSQLVFTPAASGTYYLAAGAFAGGTGTYKISATSLGVSAPTDDFAASTATTGQVAVGGSRTGSIETADDSDWLQVTLAAGQTYRIDVEGIATSAGSLIDPYLDGIYDATGTLIPGTPRDDGGTGLNSAREFTPATGGTYYIAAGATGNGTGTYKVSVSGGSAAPQPTAGNFHIDVNFSGNAAYQQYFDRAAATWDAIITGDVPDVNSATYGFIDDLRIDAAVVAIDGAGGILGQAGPRQFRSDTSLPYLGMMQFDEADLADMLDKGILQDVIEHEMGHVLGLGTLWSWLRLSSGSLYTGANALREYVTLTGTAQTSVPLETVGGAGTVGSHWAEATFDRELMTGYAERNPPMPLSRLTIGALQDLGYTVDFSTAEPFSLTLLTGLTSAASAPGAPATTTPTTPLVSITGGLASAEAGFAGAELVFYEDKPLDVQGAPPAVKLDGQVTSADAGTVFFYETTTGNGYLVELTGSFIRNDPATAGAVKGTLTGLRIYGPAGVIESYDYSADPRDAEATLNNYQGAIFSGSMLIESRAPNAQADHLTTGAGDDVLVGSLGNDTMDGGDGTDTATFTQTQASSRIGIAGNIAIVDGADGTDQLENVERVQFTGSAPVTLASLLGAPGTDELMSFIASSQTLFRLPIQYSGPLNLRYVYPGTTGDDVVAGTLSNDFVNLGDGNDAMSMGVGDDIADGGGGSNFLTGGQGHDVFYLDGRFAVPVWSCITDWEPGEQMVLWGWQPGTSVATWTESDGLPGYLGATLKADVNGDGVVETAVTFTGRTVSELQSLAHEQTGLLWFY